MDSFIKGQNICLTALTEDDIENTDWYRWFNDEETCMFLVKHYQPNTKEKQYEFLQHTQNSPLIQLYGVALQNSSELIGISSIDNINTYDRTCSLSLVLGEKKYRTTDNALEAMYLLIKHAFFTLNLRKIKTGQLQGLAIWVNMLKETFGFVQEGTLKAETFKNGQYVDVFQLALFRDDFIKHIYQKKNFFIKSDKYLFRTLHKSLTA